MYYNCIYLNTITMTVYIIESASLFIVRSIHIIVSHMLTIKYLTIIRSHMFTKCSHRFIIRSHTLMGNALMHTLFDPVCRLYNII